MSGLRCGHTDPQLFFCIFHMHPFTVQTYHTQTHKHAHLIASKQKTTSAFGINANKYTWKQLAVDTYKQKQPCVLRHTQSDILNAHTHTSHKTQAFAHRHARPHAHSHTLLVCNFCQLSPSACRLCVWHRGEGLEPHASCVLSLAFTHSK